jgi:hypothetical protein
MTKEKIISDIAETIFGSPITAGKTPLEKCEAALAKLFMPDFDTGGFPAFKGIRDAYLQMTGDNEFRWNRVDRQGMMPELRASMDITGETFPFALANAANVFLTKIYRTLPYREDIFLSQKNPADLFQPITSAQYEYFEDIPEVDPETADYDRMDLSPDGGIRYVMTTKGTLILISRKVIINDNVNLVKNIFAKLARAFRRTHARRVWSPFIDNSVCPDGTAWFTVDHGNLGNGALTIPNVATAITALAGMAESGSGEKLGLDLVSFKWNLCVPTALWQTAIQVNQIKSYHTANDLTTQIANPCYRLFGDRNERIITSPFMTDVNDWGIIRDCDEVPVIEMTYLNGRQEPELLVADSNEFELKLRGDGIGYKMRHTYGGGLVDYRGGYKSIAA